MEYKYKYYLPAVNEKLTIMKTNKLFSWQCLGNDNINIHFCSICQNRIRLFFQFEINKIEIMYSILQCEKHKSQLILTECDELDYNDN